MVFLIKKEIGKKHAKTKPVSVINRKPFWGFLFTVVNQLKESAFGAWATSVFFGLVFCLKARGFGEVGRFPFKANLILVLVLLSVLLFACSFAFAFASTPRFKSQCKNGVACHNCRGSSVTMRCFS